MKICFMYNAQLHSGHSVVCVQMHAAGMCDTFARLYASFNIRLRGTLLQVLVLILCVSDWKAAALYAEYKVAAQLRSTFAAEGVPAW